MRRRSLMVPASASIPTLISGSANLASSSMTMMSGPSTISKPPPQAMPLTAAIRGLSRLCGWFRPPNPPAPQSSSDSSPPAALFRSQPGEKKRSPAPVTMATRSAGSSRNIVNTWLRRRLAARSMAFALGRSMVTSRTGPRVAVLIPSDMSVLLNEANQCVDRHRAAPGGAHDDGIEIKLHQTLEVDRRIARASKSVRHQRGGVCARASAVAGEEACDAQSGDRGFDRGGGARRQDTDTVAQQLGQHAAGTEGEQLPELPVDAHADQQLRDAITDHLLDQQRRGQPRQALRGGSRFGGAAHVEHHAADIGLVLERGTRGFNHHRKAERLGRGHRLGGGHDLRARHRHAEGAECALALVLGQGARGGGGAWWR